MAVVGLLGATPAAQAAPSAPTPALSITTSVSGRPLPVATMTGSWAVQRPGRAATLKITGVVVAGTTTTIRSTWVSSMRRSIGLKWFCEGEFITAAPGTTDPITVRIQFRTRHGGWQELGGARMDHTSQPLDHGGLGLGSFVEFLKPLTLQWRLTVTATYDDTSRQSFVERVRSI